MELEKLIWMMISGQYFYVCIDGKIPRKSGCHTGLVFNEKNGQCDKPKNVPEW